MFEIYGKNNCVWCDRAKELLNSVGEEFVFYNIEENPNHLASFKAQWPERKTVPVVTVSDYDLGTYVTIGGYEDLVEWLKHSTEK